MSERPDSALCFRCGGPTDELNELDEGVSCPACVDRLTETLPPIFHSPWIKIEAELEAEELDVGSESSERQVDDA